MPARANDTQDSVRVLQRKLYRAAKQSRSRRFHALYDKVYRRDVLERAFDEVARNGGAAGVDGQTIDEIRQQGGDAFLSVLAAELREGSYRPVPVRRVAIAKASGGERLLGIRAVRDRVVQAAVRIVIEPIFEADFLDCSLGFRPKRSARQARERIRTHVQRERRQVVVDADIEGFFDNLDRPILMRLLRVRISDRRVLALIDRWLRTGIPAGRALLHARRLPPTLLLRETLGHVRKDQQGMVAALLRPIFNADAGDAARALVSDALERLRKPLPNVAALLEDAEDSADRRLTVGTQIASVGDLVVDASQ
jgi:hypothetical protein